MAVTTDLRSGSNPRSPGRRPLRAVVIGAGFGGIAAAIALKQAGVEELTVLEARGGVGGVWLDNQYPGCACDIPAPLYSYSFAPNPDWSRRYPPRSEIQAYLAGVVERFGLRPHLRLRTEATRAVWDDATATWAVTTAEGARYVCDVLVTAVGQLSRPQLPNLPGLPEFAGRAVHSALWDDSVDVTGKRVVVVGTGASAIQIVPEIAGRAEHVTVLQRSAPWTLPKPSQSYSALHRALRRRVPATMKIGRTATWGITQLMGLAVTGNPVVNRLFEIVSHGQRRFQVRDPELRRKATPDYAMGCKRVLFTSSWFPAISRPDVDLVTEPIDRIERDGVRTADGRMHPADLLVLSTGFAASDLVAPLEIVGRGGVPLSQAWAGGAHAYLGITVPGMPNLFLMYGPNTNTGNTSVVYFHEAQARYLAQATRLLLAQGGGSVEVRAEVEAAFDAELQQRLARSVWTSCDSWYRTDGGRVVTNWPGLATEYGRRTARFDPADYLVVPARTKQVVA